MRAQVNLPILLVDTDALADMSPWEGLAEGRAWEEFFSHIPDAKPRDNALLDLIELAKSDGCWVAYTSRWSSEHRQVIHTWLRDNGFPKASLYTRDHMRLNPVSLAHIHAKLVSAKAKGARPVFVIHNDVNIAAALRKRGVAALGVDQVPTEVKAFRAVLGHARSVPAMKTKEDN